MVVDTSPESAKRVADELGAAGFEVLVRASPIGTHAAVLRERPDVLLFELEMPSWSGVDILKSMTSLVVSRRPLLLLHSARPEAELRDIVSEHGADGYISKQRDVSSLADLLRELGSARRYEAPGVRFERPKTSILNQVAGYISVVSADSDVRERAARALHSYDVRSTDATTEVLMALSSLDPPRTLVVDTGLIELDVDRLAREALRVDPRNRWRIIWIVRENQPPVIKGLELAPIFTPEFDPTELRRAVARQRRFET